MATATKKPAKSKLNRAAPRSAKAATNGAPLVRNRIKELRYVRASELVPHPKNWRLHGPDQVAALEAAYAKVGIAGAILCRELKDGRLQIIDGHLRADTTPGQEVPCLVADVNQKEADFLLCTFDPLAALATADKGKLDALLAEMETSEPALQRMLSELVTGAERFELSDLDETSGGEELADINRGGDPKTKIAIVFHAEQIDEFEEALMATGLPNRSEALLEICRGYLAAR